jgi:hypothetical protein
MKIKSGSLLITERNRVRTKANREPNRKMAIFRLLLRPTSRQNELAVSIEDYELKERVGPLEKSIFE